MSEIANMLLVGMNMLLVGILLPCAAVRALELPRWSVAAAFGLMLLWTTQSLFAALGGVVAAMATLYLAGFLFRAGWLHLLAVMVMGSLAWFVPYRWAATGDFFTGLVVLAPFVGFALGVFQQPALRSARTLVLGCVLSLILALLLFAVDAGRQQVMAALMATLAFCWFAVGFQVGAANNQIAEVGRLKRLRSEALRAVDGLLSRIEARGRGNSSPLLLA